MSGSFKLKRFSTKDVFPLGTRFYLVCLFAAVYLFLLLYGLILAHSTGEPGAPYPATSDVRHLVRTLLGVLCAAAVVFPPWRFYEKWAYAIYSFSLAGLLAVLLFAPAGRATRRWLELGFMSFQVSEVGKIALVLALARYLKTTRRKASVRTSLVALVMTLIPIVLIAREPDLGTSLLLVPVFFSLLFCARGKGVHILIIFLAGLAVAPLLYEYGLADYQKRRLLGFMSPDAARLDPDAVLQRERAREAIGTGGFWGKGLGEGDRSLPVRKSDFVFAVVAEEMGFAGAAFLLLLYALFFYLCCEIAAGTYDLFARLTCIGIGTSVGVQALINVSVAVGLLPVTGMNLPLVSQGGSSLLATSIGAALVVNIALRPPHSLALRSRTVRKTAG